MYLFYEYIDVAFKLIIACILGAAIGLQRESVGRPAGLRTHTLVCISSSLIMVISEAMFAQYGGDMDPTRLGAQVVSGIGFLGAGTIIRDGVTVKGLTTAASLWAVACIGLATGAGMYWGALLTTLLAYLTLFTFIKMEDYVDYSRKLRYISVYSNMDKEQLQDIEGVFRNYAVNVYKIDFNKSDNNILSMGFRVKLKNVEDKNDIMSEIARLDGVISVKEE